MVRSLIPVMVGREGELAALETALDDALAGHGGTVVVSGEAGIGKSRLASELQTLAAAKGMVVIIGRAVHAGAHMPFRPLVQALQPVLRDPHVINSSQLEPFQAALGGMTAAGTPWTLAEAPLVLPEAIVQLLRVMSYEQGLLVVLEDLQWADADTLAVIEYVADCIADERVLLLCTERSEWTGQGATILGELVGRRSAQRLKVGVLSEDAVEDMARAALHQPLVPADLLVALRQRAGGVPFLIEEMLAAFVSAADTGPSVSWRIAESLPPSYRELVTVRMKALDEEGRRVVRAAAVLGRSFEWPLLASITDLEEQAVLAGLAAAAKENLIGAAGGASGTAFSFRHALSRESILADLLPPELRAISARAAEVIEDTYPGLPGEWCEHAAELRIQAGDDLGASRLLQESARRSFARGALATAEAALSRARRLVEDDAMAWMGVDELLLQVLSVAGKPQRLIELGERVLGGIEHYVSISGGTVHRARLAQVHARLARAALLNNDLPRATSHLATARRLLSSDPSEKLQVEVEALDVDLALANHELEKVLTQGSAVEQSAAELGLSNIRCDMLEAGGHAAFVLGNPEEAQHLFEEMEEVARGSGLALPRLRALTELGMVEGLAKAETGLLEEARRLAVAAGAVSTLARIDVELGWIEWGRGRTEAATAALDRALDLSQRFALPTLGMACAVQAALHALSGRREAMEQSIAQALGSGHSGAQVKAAIHGNARAVLALIEGKRETAAAELTSAVELMAGEPGRPWWFQGLSVLMGARDGADADLPITARSDPCNLAFEHYARAVVSGRKGDRDTAERSFAAGDSLMPPGWRRHLARMLVAEGAIDDGWGLPGEWATEALSHFQSVGPWAFASWAKAVMRETGVPVPRQKRGETEVPAALRSMGVTGRELEVLRLVALGISNQEIGQRLYLSPRTVESHVSSLLRKTGTETRPQLVAFAGRHSP